MKKIITYLLVFIFLLSLAGCAGSDSGNKDKNNFGKVTLTDVKTSSEESSYRIKAEIAPFTLKDFGSGMKDALETEWTQYNSLSTTDRMVSSHIWGLCYQYCKTWGDCLGFLGREIYNPLEDCDLFTDATSSALPLESESVIEYGRDYHCEVSWHGAENGELYHATVSVGYLCDDIRVVMRITFNGAEQGMYTTGSAWASTVNFSTEDMAMPNGNTAIVVTPKGTLGYSAVNSYFVQNDLLYQINVTSSSGDTAAVREVTENILALFN